MKPSKEFMHSAAGMKPEEYAKANSKLQRKISLTKSCIEAQQQLLDTLKAEQNIMRRLIEAQEVSDNNTGNQWQIIEDKDIPCSRHSIEHRRKELISNRTFEMEIMMYRTAKLYGVLAEIRCRDIVNFHRYNTRDDLVYDFPTKRFKTAESAEEYCRKLKEKSKFLFEEEWPKVPSVYSYKFYVEDILIPGYEIADYEVRSCFSSRRR